MRNTFALKDGSTHPAPPEVYNWRIYALAVSAAMGSAMFGYDSAFIGGTISLPSFQRKFGLASTAGDALATLKANIVSTFQAGCFFGAILCYPLTERFGRRFTLIPCGVLFCAGAIMQLASEGMLGLIYGGRVLTGLSIGASSLLVPIYISECSPPAIRGRIVGIFEILLQLALVVGFWVNYTVAIHIPNSSDSQWRIPFGIQLIPGTLLVIFMSFQPESPRWLIKAGRTELAIKNLSRIRNLPPGHEYITWEVDTVNKQIEHEASLGASQSLIGKLKEIMLPGNRNRLLIGMSLMMFQNLSGINALNYYSPTIFKSIGFSGTTVGLLATGVFGIVKALSTIIFVFFGVDRFGRRNSLLVGSVGALAAMYYLAGFSEISGSFSGKAKRDAGAYVGILMIYIFAIFYAFSWNGIPWIFCAEVFPIGIRSVCLVFTTCTQWLGQFIVVYSTPYMMNNITYGTFLFFGSSLVCGIIFAYFFVPETKGLTLENMDIMFNLSGPANRLRPKTDRILASDRVELCTGGASNETLVEKCAAKNVEPA